ncbi:MAG: cytochrome c [Rubripirellula sp.]|nr:cytochrome c [Rubripirellula sp.]
MSDARSNPTKHDQQDESSGFQMPPTMFAGLALFLLTFLVLLGFLAVISASYVHSALTTDQVLDRGWALLSALALGWALVNLFWSRKAAQARDRAATYSHVALALGCGLIALGIHSVLFARALGSQPVVMDYSQSDKQTQSSVATPVAMTQGNAEEGLKIFSTTCITCHGPTGGGLPNLAPSLRGSEFIASADDAAVAAVIRLGRPATDPNNKTKKVMPARGGNPFLGDDKIVHLVAFIRAVQGAGAENTTNEVDPNAPPPVQLAKWVVPAGPTPPSGMISLRGREDIGDDASLKRRSQHRRDLSSQVLVLSLTFIHGIFLVGVMVISSETLFRRLNHEGDLKDEKAEWRFSTVGWSVAAAVWLIVLVMGFVWV